MKFIFIIMFSISVFFSCLLICNEVSTESNFTKYFNLRRKIVEEELFMSFGSKMKLDAKEEEANKILMNYKNQEFQSVFRNHRTFLPSKNFLKVSSDIKQSKVFQIIRKMPKGGVLHAHAKAITSREFIINNITRRSNLYVCNKFPDDLILKFFDESTAKSSTDCHWKLLELARKSDIRVDETIEEALSMYDVNSSNSSYAWKRFLKIFKFIKPLITYRPVYEDFLYSLLKEIYDDNLQFIEIRTPFSNLYELNGDQHDHLQVMEICKTVVDRFIEDHPLFMGVKWIYSPQRRAHHSTFAEYINNFRALKARYPDLITGFDLVGQEDRGRPLKNFIPELQELGRETNFFFHAGETNWNGQQTDENLIDAILLNTKRIGHGYALVKHPLLMDLVKAKKIAIEVSPISNQVLNLVKDLRNHPAAHFFARDLPVVVSNDDPSFWGARALSYDFYEAFIGIMSSKSDLRALKQLALNSIVHSSMNMSEKNLSMKIWDQRWKEFIDMVIKIG